MRIVSNTILFIEALVAIYVLGLICYNAWALWQLDKATLITIGFCMAIYLFLWPDPKPKLNSKINNPYHNGRK